MSLVLILAGVSAAGGAAAQNRLFRPGTVALGGGGNLGVITGKGRYGFDFNGGQGYNITIKYTVARSVALGVNFQNLSYDWVASDCFDDVAPEDCPRYRNLVMTTFEGQAYLYRNRRSDAPQYFMLGIGVYRPELRVDDTSTVFPEANLMLSTGLGAEVFLRENWALDLGVRAVGFVGNGIADQEAFLVRGGDNISFGLHAQAGILYFITQ